MACVRMGFTSPGDLLGQFERKLYLPLGRLRWRRELARRWNHIVAAVEDLRLRHLKSRPVEQIERFHPELYAPLVRQHPVLQEGGIDVLHPRCPERVAAQIAELTEDGECETFGPDVILHVARIG